MHQITKLRTMDKDELINLISSSTSKMDVFRALSISSKNSQIIKFLKEFIILHNIDISHHSQGNPAHKKFTKEDVEKAVKANISWAGVMRELKFKVIGSNISTVRKLIKFYNVDISHFDLSKAISDANKTKRTKENILCIDSSAGRQTLKKFIDKNNLIKYECRDCKMGNIWNDKPIVLNIEHINGINNDNRLENLCFLCPNCHSQTSTFAGRKNKKIKC